MPNELPLGLTPNMHDVTNEEIAARIAACHENIQKFYGYWFAKKGGRAMPRRAISIPSR